ncbi:hypothetical protein V7S77_03225 [Aquirufa ecclesiirivi]|uniref:hypothetical protein n=1 Tax=Aquirufa ecclesiirivi TaxID=2715124 RepID=UPI0022A83EF7|nr:hypothetical protein [Aquirufa ecclesiirivi]MCZ2471276.1 hypothetical protein [Aquirufa ecclesiirivi]
MPNLKAKYTFVSPITGNTYVLHVQTGPFTNPIVTLDNPNCIGWTILSGTFVTVIDGVSTSYNVPSGNTGMIYNGLWQSAAASPDGSALCQGIDRLIVTPFDGKSTPISAVSGTSVQITLGKLSDTANLISSVFPPQ